MEWGDDIEFLTEVSLRRGELTDSLQKMPDLNPDLMLVWDVFAILSNARSKYIALASEGKKYMAPARLKVGGILELLAAADVIGLEQKFRILRFVQAMDKAYIDKVTAGVK